MKPTGPVFGGTKQLEGTKDAEIINNKLQTSRKHKLVKPLIILAFI